MMKQFAVAALALAVSTSAFALRTTSTNEWPAGRAVAGNRGQQNRELRHAINAKRREVRALRRAGDPRAAFAEQQLRNLEWQWQQMHPNNGERDHGRGHGKFNKQGHDRDDD